MTDTIREQIISNCQTNLAGIRIDSGYNTEIGRFVKRAIKIVDENEIPGIVIWPGVEDNVKIPGKHDLTFPIIFEAVSTFGEVNSSIIAEKMLGDLIKFISNPSNDISGSLTDGINYISGGADDYPEPGIKTVSVRATFNFKYKTNLGDPYQQ